MFAIAEGQNKNQRCFILSVNLNSETSESNLTRHLIHTKSVADSKPHTNQQQNNRLINEQQ